MSRLIGNIISEFVLWLIYQGMSPPPPLTLLPLDIQVRPQSPTLPRDPQDPVRRPSKRRERHTGIDVEECITRARRPHINVDIVLPRELDLCGPIKNQGARGL